MSTSIFVNISSEDLDRSKAFYSALGWSINPNFTDENAACIVIDENIYFMVLTREFFTTFTDKKLIDPHTDVSSLIALSCDSRDAVDEMITKGVAAGGKEPNQAQDMGFMYSRDLEDPDGNGLEFLYMVPEAAEKGPEAYLGEHSTQA